MKPKHLFYTLSFVTIFFSCKKTNLDRLSLEHLKGDYHFIYGQDSQFDFTTNDEYPTQHGIRIKDRQVLFFENGEEIAKTCIYNECAPYDFDDCKMYSFEYDYFVVKYNNQLHQIGFHGDTLFTIMNPNLETQPFEICAFLKD